MRRLPAEWEPQSAVMLTWPHAATDWAPQLARVEQLYAALSALICRYQPLLLVCHDTAHLQRVRDLATTAGAEPKRLRLLVAPSQDTWARDHGPIGVEDAAQGARLLDFRFNGWGGKYAAAVDDRIPSALHAAGAFADTPLESSPLVLEGGAIESDGKGTLLAVSRTILDPARNPGWTGAAIEQELRQRLGVTRYLWLEEGAISGDDTDGHIDTLVRFCAPDTLCYARCEDPHDADYPALSAMEAELQALRDAQGQPYRLLPLPCPRPIHDSDGARLPAGYANFLIINGALLLPTYADPADARAAEVLQQAFPDRQIHGLDCRPLIRQGGSLHCISMQIPAAVPIGPAGALDQQPE